MFVSSSTKPGQQVISPVAPEAEELSEDELHAVYQNWWTPGVFKTAASERWRAQEPTLRLDILTDAHSLDFAALTFPAFRKFLGGRHGPMVYVGATIVSDRGRVPVGLAMARLYQGSFELVSLYAGADDPGYLKQEALLHIIVTQCASLGCTRGIFEAGYLHDDEALPRMLARCGWSIPRVHQISIKSTVARMLELPFLIKHGDLRPGSEIVPWFDIGEDLRTDLAERLTHVDPAVRFEIDPFVGEVKAWRQLSFALIRNNQIVGWHLPEFFDLRTIRWTISVSMPGHNAMAIVLQLWLHALRAQQARGLPNLIFAAYDTHPHFQQFMLRRLPPAAEQLRLHARFKYGQPA